jgi:hypothetical protein
MNSKTLTTVAVIAFLLIFGTAIVIKLNTPPGIDSSNSTTPLGGLFQRATAVSRLKQQMGDLREVFPAMTSFAREHQDDLPKTITELRPYLPAKLATLDDQHWEIPSSGKMTPLVTSPTANGRVLFQEKNTPPGKAKIIVYADGHIEYKRE